MNTTMTMRDTVAVEDREENLYKRILFKFKQARLNIASILAKCEKRDKNRDGILHFDDLEEIIQDGLGEYRLTIRESTFLQNQLTADKRKRTVLYNNISSFFEREQNDTIHLERWRDNNVTLQQTQQNIPSGSIGEFLQSGACPAEIKNFKLFIAMLEQYEKKTGMKTTTSDEGFVIPLGPDLRVNIEFFLG